MKLADDREEVLLREALARAIGPERQAFLDQACAGNQALRARLEGLLQGHQGPDPFLEAQTAPSGITTVLVPLEEGPGTLIGRYKATRQQVALLRLRKGLVFSTVAFSADGNILVVVNGHALQTWRAPSWAEIEAVEKRTESKTQ